LDRLFGRVDQFLSIGSANRSFYLVRGIPPARISCAPYCVENRVFRQRANEARKRRAAIRQSFNIPANAFCIVFAGKFVRKKRPGDLVRAVAGLSAAQGGKDIHLLFVGSGELGRDLRDATSVQFDAERFGIPIAAQRNKPPASFAGFLNQSRMGEAYAAADCLVLPSEAGETWGLVVNEAMASGLPCIVSEACGCAEDLVKPLRPDLCYPCGDTDALAVAIKAVMVNPPTAAAIERAIERYDYLRTVEAVENLYQADFGRLHDVGAGLAPA
jgi:glycosyltransferase involved in cell wall biosynthesis